MERLSTTQTAGAGPQDNKCISLIPLPVNVLNADNQAAVAVQSLIDSQQIQEPQDEEEDIFQCGKCKKQFTSIQLFMAHKQTPCLRQQQQPPHPPHPPPQPSLQTQPIQPQTTTLPSLQQPQSLTLTPGNGMFATSTLNLAPNFAPNQISSNGPVLQAQMSTSGPVLQAHPVLSRSLNQPANGMLTLGGLPSSPLSQLPQNMILTGEDFMTLASLDPSSLNAQSIQMVTGPVQPNHSNSVTILSPIGNLTTSPNNLSAATVSTPHLHLLQQPTQQITLIPNTDKNLPQPTTSQPPQHNQILQQQSSQLVQQISQPQQTTLPLAPAAPGITQIQQNISHHAANSLLGQPIQQPGQIQQHMFKPGPTKAGRKTAQNLIPVMNSDNANVSLLSARKGKTARNATALKLDPGDAEVDIEATPAKPKLTCQYCNKTFGKNFDLQQHIRAHTGEKPFQCIVCGRAFAQKSNVKKHMATHKVWPAGISNTLPKQPSPILLPPPVEKFEDGSTDKGNQETESFDPNNKALDPTESTDNEDIKFKFTVDNSYVCQYCPSKFKTYYQLKTHLVKHKNEQVYKCMLKTCGQSFHELDSFLKHVKTHENEMTYRCHKCHKYFPSLYELGVHQFTHSLYPTQGHKSGPRHFQCSKCGNKYTTPEALEHHMSTVSHEFKCPHCEKQFTCERFLRRHLPIHGTFGQFECMYCQKKFKTEHYLKMHILIHTGETPFSCHICQATFNRKDKLKRHMTIHDAVKKYRCPFRNVTGCLKEFNRPDKLKCHIITHSGIKPHKCSICPSTFSRKQHLEEHERGHRAEYRYKCEKCGKGFFRPKPFKEHRCPSTPITEQIFRPKNRRKMGRPKRRMVTITADSIAKCRGKRYVSRTRGGKKNDTLDRTDKQNGTCEQVNNVTTTATTSTSVSQENESQIQILPSLVSTSTSSMSQGLTGNDNTKTVSVELVKALPLMSSGADCSASLIDLDGTGIGVDHYVVHLAESIDGSSSVRTAFIPAGPGNSLFAAPSDNMGIHPITIIEAAAGQNNTPAVSASDFSNALMLDPNTIKDGQQNMIFTLANRSNGDDCDNTEVGNSMVNNLVDKNDQVFSVGSYSLENNFVKDENKTVNLLSQHSSGNLLSQGQFNSNCLHQLDAGNHENTTNYVANIMENLNQSMNVTDPNADKDDKIAMMKNESRDAGSVGNSVVNTVDLETSTDMLDMSGHLALFQTGGNGLVEGQVVVSGSQAFLTCPSQLVDYSTDNVYNKSPL